MTKVALRQKKISKGRSSLFLDYYPAIILPSTGKSTRREFLKMFIYDDPTSKQEKDHNKETHSIASAIRSQREVQLRNREFGFKDNIQYTVDFIDYYQKIVDEYYETSGQSNYLSWQGGLKHLKFFSKGVIFSNQIDIRFIQSYRKYLLSAKSLRNLKSPKQLSRNTVASYFKNFIYVIKRAYKDKIIDKNYAEDIDYIKEVETRREYLTEDELKVLWHTPIKKEIIKHMALFSSLTGLRFSDVSNLLWSNVVLDKHLGYYVKLTEQKTKNTYNHPISETAYKILCLYKENTTRVFGNIKYSQIGRPLSQWIEDSGIQKKISFHNFRHSYATLQLANGTDIYTVSKLLGHKNVSTTQIYTKVIDAKKVEAANRINIDLDEL